MENTMVKCKECGIEKETDKKLHFHLRAHKMSQEAYYHKHYPRLDLYTGKLIPFTNKEDYFNKFFVTKGNFSKFLKTANQERIKEVLADLVESRKGNKGITYELSDVELISMEWPSKKQLHKLYDDYSEFQNLLVSRYKQEDPPLIMFHPATFYVDTREQKPYELGNRQVCKLEFGDYAAEVGGELTEICIERKSMMDFIGSFSPRQVSRLESEFARAEQAGKKLIVLVEKDLRSMMSYDRMPKIQRFVKIPPQVVFHNVRALIQQFANVQFLFCKNRQEAEGLSRDILTNEHLFDYDLQYLYNKNIFHVE